MFNYYSHLWNYFPKCLIIGRIFLTPTTNLTLGHFFFKLYYLTLGSDEKLLSKSSTFIPERSFFLNVQRRSSSCFRQNIPQMNDIDVHRQNTSCDFFLGQTLSTQWNQCQPGKSAGTVENPARPTISQINIYYQAIWYHKQMYVYRKDLLSLKL